MSLFRFEITDDHLNLLRNLDWQAEEDGNTGDFGIPYLSKNSPFGDLPNFSETELMDGDGNEVNHGKLFSDKVIRDAALLIYGNKSDEAIDDPFQEGFQEFTKEEKEYAKKVLSGLYLALDIIFHIGEFKTGKFVTEHYMRNWREE